MTPSRHNLADQQHPAPRVVRHSPHVLNLKGTIIVVAEPVRPKNPYRGHFSTFHHLLDQRLHLNEWRNRSLSVRTRGWRDFPPTEAVTLAEAVIITAARFVDEHPMADLTIVSLAHLAVLTVWKGFIMPAEHVAGRVAKRRAASAAAKTKATAIVKEKKFLPKSVEGRKNAAPLDSASLRSRKKATSKSFYSSITKLEKRLRRPPGLTFKMPHGWKASLAGFAAMSLLMVAPVSAYGMIKNDNLPIRTLVTTARDAAGSLVAAAQAAQTMDFAAAHDQFQQAEAGFAQADDGLGALGRAVSYAAAFAESHSQLAAAAPLLDAGRETAAAGAVVSDTMRRIAAHPEASNIDKLRLLDGTVATILPHVEKAVKALDAVPVDAVPAEYRERIAAAKAEAPRALAALRQASPAIQFLIAAAGGDGLRRYMLVFQNQTELRATGGFIGSFAVVDVKDGKLESMNIPGGGSYDLQGQLNLRLASPQPLHLINPHWQFQDANWYPNFPTSAELLSRFYEHSGGTTVDGIVAVNASVMVRLLRVFGPVDMPDYGKVIDADNFLVETQKAVELEYDRTENRPKQFLADLAPKLIERVLKMEPATAVTLGRELLDAATERETTVWMRTPGEQQMIERLGWDGGVRAVSGDYLMVVHSNIAGQKTDGVMSDSIDRTAKILPDGSVIVTLALTRTHGGEKRALFNGVRNVDYVRFYVPLGAELVEARGFDAPDPKLFKIPEDGFVAEDGVAAEERDATYDRTTSTRVSVEDGKTVFGNWLQTDPGESTAATLIYRLPVGFVRVQPARVPTWLDQAKALWQAPTAGPTMDYAFTFQKQSGANPLALKSAVELSPGWFVQTAEPAVTVDDRGRQALDAVIDSDRYFHLTATTAVR
jgi:hypothetical protein